MSGWDHESKALFTSARSALSPTEANRERVRARLTAKLGAAAVGGAVGATLTTSTAKAATAGTSVAAGTGAAVKTGAAMIAAKLAAPLLVVGALATANTVPTETPSMRVDALPSAAAPPAVHVRPAAAAPGAETRDEAAVREEAALVSRIDAELRAGRHSSVTRLAAEHERRFPDGLLAEEREGARVLARCATAGAAGSGVDVFLAAHPRSPMRERIVTACRARPE